MVKREDIEVIEYLFKDALHPKKQIRILAELYATTQFEIKGILRNLGYEVNKLPTHRTETRVKNKQYLYGIYQNTK